ncbi:MAG: DUF2071 domain-containing protein [Planctomycetota bacterium]|nr:DUF2071 domain-containing protein [Planctomycetota bacterium]
MFIQDPQKREEISLYRALMTSLLFTIVAHALGLLSMATILRPGVADNFNSLEQAQYIAEYPNLWRLGWLPWNLSALGNLIFGVILIAWTRSRPNKTGWILASLAFLLTICAVIPDQYGEFLLDTELVHLAQSSAPLASNPQDPILNSFAQRQRELLTMLGYTANNLYILMSIVWIFVILRICPQSPARNTFVAVSYIANIFFVGVSAASLARENGPTDDFLTQFWVMMALNGLSFPLLLLQMILMAVTLGEAHHQNNPSPDSQLHHFRWPDQSKLSILAHMINARGLRDLIRASSSIFPIPVMKSDIRDVVYLNWMVPEERARRLCPKPLKLDVRNGKTAISLLTYQHGHFGPAFYGPLRKFLPSPCQSNWRIYVEPENPQAKRDAIYFFKTTISGSPHAIGSRLMSDGLPSHLSDSFTHIREQDRVVTQMTPGHGSAPDLHSEVLCKTPAVLPDDFKEFFASWNDAVGYLVEQNRGVNVLSGMGEVLESRIDIPIEVSKVEPAQVKKYESQWLKELTAGCEVFAFVVPSVPFRALGESYVEVESANTSSNEED